MWALGGNKIGDSLKYTSFLTVTITILCFFFAFNVSAEDSFFISSKQIKALTEGQGVIFRQPNGPFAVMLFNEFALGTHFGIIYYQQMGNPADEKWWISERFWQENPWNANITSLAWSHDGKYLYVGTSEVYGDGGLFKLYLFNKTYSRLYPKAEQDLKNISSTEIIKIDNINDKLKVEVTLADYKTIKIVEISTD
jgi:hypothetical protein